MQLKTITKLVTVISILLFCFAVGFYAFMRLEAADRNRNVNLFSLVPSNCVGVLESDHIHEVLGKFPMLNYSQELNSFHFPGLFDFFLSELDVYASEHAHGLNEHLNHFLVSFHAPVTPRNQVIYFQMDHADEQMLSDILRNYASDYFLPKEEMYRGKNIFVYPLNHEEFLAAYMEDSFFVVSYQKRLIEEVIDALLDGTTLSDDELFSQIVNRKKTSDFLTLYTRTPFIPLLKTQQPCWNEYEFHMNSDVVYLTGETFVSDGTEIQDTMAEAIQTIPLVHEADLFISADKDSTSYYMNEAYDANESGKRLLYNECLSNLSNEATFSMVVDMQKVMEDPERFQSYLTPFMLENASLFRPFILSAQCSLSGNRPSHMWVFTYKY